MGASECYRLGRWELDRYVDPDKVLSLFEPQTEAIRKGKAAKPTEFGKVVKIQEAEAQFITDYAVCPTRVPGVVGTGLA